ncbi:MAG: DNA polymerase IV, partial [Chloroflexi bacterium]|nr:DNA polymerase IV [Chloroflexota bacterium]
EERGVVAAASYPARAFGIRSAMPMSRALARCPQAIVCPPRHRLYGEYSRRVMAILRAVTPLMEQMSIDEAYLDVTDQVDVWEDAIAVAQQLQTRVRAEVGLSASLGVAANKLVAKVASEQDKPGGLTVVRPGAEAAFLAPLPVRVLWGVGPVTADRLAQLGITTVGELAGWPRAELQARFGQHGAEMAQQAQGLDSRPVVVEHEVKSVSQETTFAQDLAELVALKRQLWALSQGVSRRLERAGLAAGTVGIKLRYSDFTTLTRQTTLAVPTQDEIVIYRAALTLLERNWQPGRPVRLLGVAGQRLAPPAGQLMLLPPAE